jgi:hypothetical protein
MEGVDGGRMLRDVFCLLFHANPLPCKTIYGDCRYSTHFLPYPAQQKQMLESPVKFWPLFISFPSTPDNLLINLFIIRV